MGNDIDADGLVVGTSDVTGTVIGNSTEAFLWGPAFGMVGLGSAPSGIGSQANGTTPHRLGDSILVAGSTVTTQGITHATLWSVTLGLRPYYTLIPGSNFRAVPKIFWSWPYDGPATDRYVYVVFFGAPNLDVHAIDRASLQLNGNPVTHTAFRDVNGDGVPDLVMLFSLHQLKTSGAITLRTRQLDITGNLLNNGTPLQDLSPVIICTDPQTCLPDDTVGN